ncbi:MAG TPA: thiol-disulfide oxidoreductase DCC family protein [Pyrinomonadaceae bacterium]|jgi:predicted DCC family thiol-disulfide oxidoreductase YuxK|nr:thiol-disulfide oxidoreductase DCC family protein [Pyrinomonadaceae bacterium]
MERIVLFDGVCNFCNGAVNFIIRHDPQSKFKFAPLQSEFGEQMKAKFGIGDDVDSIVLIEDGKAYLHSAAAVRLARGLGGIWSIGYTAIIIPAPIRDWFYKLFAKYRYRLFGKQDVCMMPTPDVRARFIT